MSAEPALSVKNSPSAVQVPPEPLRGFYAVPLSGKTASPSPCQPCQHAVAHGWWGPGHKGTHCPGCHRSWTSAVEAHCATCHEHFSRPANFDRHLAPRGCRNPAEIRTKAGAPVLVQDDRGTWRGYVSPEAAEALRAVRGRAS